MAEWTRRKCHADGQSFSNDVSPQCARASSDVIPGVEPASVRVPLNPSLLRGHLDHLSLENPGPITHLSVLPFAKASGLHVFSEEHCCEPGFSRPERSEVGV